MCDKEGPGAFDWVTDLTSYQHAPCMFTLWWLGLLGNAIYDIIKDLMDDGEAQDDGGDAGDDGGDAGEGGDGA